MNRFVPKDARVVMPGRWKKCAPKILISAIFRSGGRGGGLPDTFRLDSAAPSTWHPVKDGVIGSLNTFKCARHSRIFPKKVGRTARARIRIVFRKPRVSFFPNFFENFRYRPRLGRVSTSQNFSEKARHISNRNSDCFVVRQRLVSKVFFGIFRNAVRNSIRKAFDSGFPFLRKKPEVLRKRGLGRIRNKMYGQLRKKSLVL